VDFFIRKEIKNLQEQIQTLEKGVPLWSMIIAAPV